MPEETEATLMDDQVADTLPVTPAVIRWARTRAGFGLEDAKRYFKKIDAWEEGGASPTYAQLEQMAQTNATMLQVVLNKLTDIERKLP